MHAHTNAVLYSLIQNHWPHFLKMCSGAQGMAKERRKDKTGKKAKEMDIQ